MIWIAFLPVLVSCVFGNKTVEQVPFFHGHVFENSSPGCRVNGLSIPLKRLNSLGLCGAGDSGSAATHFKLQGDGSENFRVFAHHKRGHILLKTSGILDREERAEYALGLGLCCGQCIGISREEGEGSPVVAEVASIKVDVLDTNDHQPKFPDADVKLSLDDATALRTSVYTVSARDDDSGKNAELIYFALPRNGSFYAVPKTGDILLVDSILGLNEPIKFQVFARDRGWPPRTSQSVAVEINPRQWPVVPSPNPTQGKLKLRLQSKVPERRSRSVAESDSPVFINVSEDAGIGSVVMNLNPVRFQAASFELVEPDVESSPVSVSRDTGDIVISRKLDRETEPLVEISVKVQDKRGGLSEYEEEDEAKSFLNGRLQRKAQKPNLQIIVSVLISEIDVVFVHVRDVLHIIYTSFTSEGRYVEIHSELQRKVHPHPSFCRLQLFPSLATSCR
ncbi:uncharacterized protein V6R79_007626 [Siganus canaliculatus]